MKKIAYILLILAMCISLCACGQVEKNDEGFLNNLGKALEASWKDSEKDSSGDVVYKEHLRGLVNTELEILGSYEDYTFEDERLSELARQYFEALDRQLEGLVYYDADHMQYSRIYTGQGYNQKVKALYYIENEYGLNVSDKHYRTLKDHVASGERLIEIAKILDQPLNLEDTGRNCEIVLENTTKYDLDNVRLVFNLLDDAGVVVSNNTDYVESWPAGTKYRATLYKNDADFTTVEMCLEHNTNYSFTDFVPVVYVNNMIIEITPPELPAELSYGYRNRTYSKCIVNTFRYDISSWSDGLAGVRFYFSGVKTYDRDGDKTNGNCRFAYKLLAEDGTVAGSGTVHQSTIRTGEDFKDADAYCNNIAPGKYTLVLENDF